MPKTQTVMSKSSQARLVPPKLMYAIIWKDEAGETIELFKTLEMAQEFLEVVKQ